MRFTCSLIVVSDINRSRHFYEMLLKQTVKYDFGENVTFHGDFAIHLKDHFENLVEKHVTQGSNNFELYFEHDDLDNFVKELKDNGVELIHELREQPWRQKVIRFYDPDRHIVEVGESMEHLAYRLSKENLSIEQISKIILLPESFVQSSIKHF